MNIDYAIERLYQSGWVPGLAEMCQELPDGRRIPALPAVQREFSRAGLTLRIKHNLVFDCYRASWQPEGAAAGSGAVDPLDPRSGTVIASSEIEAAVFALAQYRELQTLHGVGSG